MLEFHVRRLQASGLPIYIATTTLPEDDVTELHARQLGIPCFRGSSDDVLSRYHAPPLNSDLTLLFVLLLIAHLLMEYWFDKE